MKTWLKLSDGRLKKPILRVGTFQKQSDGTQFTFTKEHLDYFAGAFSHKIPVPLEHTTEPDANRGWCVGMEVEGDYLNGFFEFSELVEDPNIFDTSVYVPIENGRVQPIEHVALTSYPVVDGLGKFESIACSLVPMQEEKSVSTIWASLKTALELSEDLTEETAVEVLTKRFAALKALELSNANKTPPVLTIEQVKEKQGKLFKFAHDGRKAKIESLPLSKAVRDKLVGLLCSDKGIALSLSNDTEDIFDELTSILSENEVLELGERSGVQLSDTKKESFLVRDAKRRAGIKS